MKRGRRTPPRRASRRRGASDEAYQVPDTRVPGRTMVALSQVLTTMPLALSQGRRTDAAPDVAVETDVQSASDGPATRHSRRGMAWRRARARASAQRSAIMEEANASSVVPTRSNFELRSVRGAGLPGARASVTPIRLGSALRKRSTYIFASRIPREKSAVPGTTKEMPIPVGCTAPDRGESATVTCATPRERDLCCRSPHLGTGIVDSGSITRQRSRSSIPPPLLLAPNSTTSSGSVLPLYHVLLG